MPRGYYFDQETKEWVKKDENIDSRYASLDLDSWGVLITYFRQYPDRFLDLIESENADFTLAFPQRMYLRAFVRFEDYFLTAGRGSTKTYTGFLGMMLVGVFYPGEKMRYISPSYVQSAELASSTFEQITRNYPILSQMWRVTQNGSDTFEMETQFGSVISITKMRGINVMSVLAEEVGQEEIPRFDWDNFKEVVLPSVRTLRMINKRPDPHHIDLQKRYITSAGRAQSGAAEARKAIYDKMVNGGNAIVLDVPAEISVLFGIRDISWYSTQRSMLSPEAWMREMQSIYTGNAESAIVRDVVLAESSKIMLAEFAHCGDPECIYVIGYDVSYEDGAKNAKCGISVLKLTRQTEDNKRDRYLKQLVYVCDIDPQAQAYDQAKYLKQLWYQYTKEDSETYIVIDSWQYGRAVMEWLCRDLNDGLPTLACLDHAYPDLEEPGATFCIYPLRATGGGSGDHDPDAEMIRYAEMEFEHGNVLMLTPDVNAGVDAYKRYHRIKDSVNDYNYAVPYEKCKQLRLQIDNLTKKLSGTNMKEFRISRHIQRDMWSATKYALRFAQILEQKNLIGKRVFKNAWEQEIAKMRGATPVFHGQSKNHRADGTLRWRGRLGTSW